LRRFCASVVASAHIHFPTCYEKRGVRTWLGRFAIPMPSNGGAGAAIAAYRTKWTSRATTRTLTKRKIKNGLRRSSLFALVDLVAAQGLRCPATGLVPTLTTSGKHSPWLSVLNDGDVQIFYFSLERLSLVKKASPKICRRSPAN